ncbi:hypothetical protein RSOLAG1IB_06664 [Rhizoctonia solani AG-1 IB]|uniref:Uncharacterized protein n=1 Tax=Thanatephorus cucumeris (strain AG1-IB / isolate 7/3/14) TaxID=1108050 RepID=A0A0B7FCB3_THACB|nr:hypothetical protein RSOLAG1IB_06664 [Rhizoctonia solani AG-1 IB]
MLHNGICVFFSQVSSLNTDLSLGTRVYWAVLAVIPNFCTWLESEAPLTFGLAPRFALHLNLYFSRLTRPTLSTFLL